MSSNQVQEQIEVKIRSLINKHADTYNYKPEEGEMFGEREVIFSDTGFPFTPLDNFISDLVELYEQK